MLIIYKFKVFTIIIIVAKVFSSLIVPIYEKEKFKAKFSRSMKEMCKRRENVNSLSGKFFKQIGLDYKHS